MSDTTNTPNTPKEELHKLAQEYRNDWGDFDGRMFQSEVCCIADNITDNDKAKKELRKLGAEYRADWSGVDGRMVASELYCIADTL